MSELSKTEELKKKIEDLEGEVSELKEREKALQESRNELAEIFALSLDMLCVADIHTMKFLKVNPAFTTILGYAESDLIGRSFLDRVHPDDVQPTIRVTEEKLKAGLQVVNFINRYRRTDGTYRWLEWVSHPVLERGVTFAVAHDITDRKNTERALLESESFTRAVMDNLPIGIAVNSVDPSVRFEYVNERFYKYYRTTKEALAVPDGFWDAVYECPQFREEMRTRILEDCASGDPARMQWKDVPIVRKGEETTYITARNIPVPEKGLMISTVWDVTDRIKTETALRETKRLLEETQSITKLGGWEYDVLAERLTWTDEVYRIHGLELESGPIDVNRVLRFYAEVHLPLMKQAFKRAVDLGESYDLELELIRKDGRCVWVRTMGRPIHKDGKVVRVTGNIIDITELKQIEGEREKLQSQLLQAQKMESVGRLAGGVAHDFNNMLGVILGHGEFALERLEPNHPARFDLEEILKAAERSANLTRQLLAFARKQVAAPKVLELNAVVTGMLKMLQRLIGEDIELNWSPGKELWPVKVDPSQIDQILANLCVNARDAIKGVGNITIETENASFDRECRALHPDAIPGEFVLIAVSDNGCGMEQETVRRLFEPFFTTKGLGQGTGLGLATVYGIVNQNKGFILVDSELDRGATFRIYLPRYEGELSGVLKDDVSSRSIQYGRETVLVVEDEPANLKLVTMMLEKLQYNVLAAGAPSAAIRKAEDYDGDIHLVITDVVMPEMNGKDLSLRLQALYPNLKILFTSGYTANVIAHHGVLEEGVYFIEKPFSKKDLADKIRVALSEEKRGE